MSTRSRPRLRSRVVAVAVASGALLSVGAPGAVADGPIASASASCKTPRYPGSGYFTSLRVSRTGCATGRKVALAHYRCRIRKGRAGRCSGRPSGYRCSERRTSIPTEINARVSCRRGSASVVFTYQQNT